MPSCRRAVASTSASTSATDETNREGSTLSFSSASHRHDDVDRHAVACVVTALSEVAIEAPRIFVATDQPGRVERVVADVRAATGRSDLVFDFLNASTVDPVERQRMDAVALTDWQGLRMGKDWGPLGHERWLSVVDFYLLASAKVLVGTLSSTFSELAAAVQPASALFLYDPIYHLRGEDRRVGPKDREYLTDYGPHFACLRADLAWPLPQYVRLRYVVDGRLTRRTCRRPAHARDWACCLRPLLFAIKSRAIMLALQVLSGGCDRRAQYLRDASRSRPIDDQDPKPPQFRDKRPPKKPRHRTTAS